MKLQDPSFPWEMRAVWSDQCLRVKVISKGFRIFPQDGVGRAIRRVPGRDCECSPRLALSLSLALPPSGEALILVADERIKVR